MSDFIGVEHPHRPNWHGFMDTLMRKGTPDRVYHIELFQDGEIRDAIAERYDLTERLDPNDPFFEQRKYVAVQRFCGFDYVLAGLVDLPMPLFSTSIADTADLKRRGGRNYQDEHRGPIMSHAEFDAYPWPDPRKPSATRILEWFQENLPDDMCIIGGLTGHFAEYLSWLMGYETLCYALFDERGLVQAIYDRLLAQHSVEVERMLGFDRVKVIWGSDDMGFKTGLLFHPNDMRKFVLAGHKKLAAMSHAAGRPYILHSCGNLSEIMDDLVHDVKIDGKHSYEDTIEDVREVKRTYGRHIGVLGGIDVDFLCRSDEAAIRRRVRDTLAVCQQGGGYMLGTGNTVANYIPLDNYLAMVDEGMRWGM